MNTASVDRPATIVHVVFRSDLMHLNGLVMIIERDMWIDSVIIFDSIATGIPCDARIATSRVLEVPDSIIKAGASAARFVHFQDDAIVIHGD